MLFQGVAILGSGTHSGTHSSGTHQPTCSAGGRTRLVRSNFFNAQMRKCLRFLHVYNDPPLCPGSAHLLGGHLADRCRSGPRYAAISCA